jgi:hypothetical protein
MKNNEINFKIIKLEKIVSDMQLKSKKRKLMLENILIILFLSAVAVVGSKITMEFWN